MTPANDIAAVSPERFPLASLKRRFPAFDLMRVVAIAIIIQLHCSMDGVTPEWWNRLVGVLTGGSLMVFFAVSGALLLPVVESPWRFYLRRIHRVAIPVVVWSVLFLLMAYRDGAFSFPMLVYILEKVPFCQTSPTMWFGYTIVGLYLFLPLVSPWLERASRRDMEGALAIWVIAYGVPFYQMHTGDFLVRESAFGPFFSCLGYMVAGFYLVRWRFLSRETPWWLYAAVAVVGVILPLLGWMRYDYADFDSRALSVTPNSLELVVGVMMFSVIWRLYGGMGQPVAFSGKMAAVVDSVVASVSRASFGMYLNHWLLLKYVIPEFLGVDFSDGFLFGAVVFVCSYLLAVVCRHIPFIGKYLG